MIFGFAPTGSSTNESTPHSGRSRWRACALANRQRRQSAGIRIQMNRRTLLASLAATPLFGMQGARARDPSAPYRIGVLTLGSRELLMDELAPPVRKLLADVGYVEGRNLTVEWRAMGLDDSIGAAMAEELVRLQMDVLMTHGTPPTKAFQAATRTIPIATVVGDPIASGFTRSLARPSSNITGLSLTHPETPAKQVELLRKTLRRLERIVFIDNIDYCGGRENFLPYEAARQAGGVVGGRKETKPAASEESVAGRKKTTK